MADRVEKVRIDLEANDDASKPIEGIADDVDKLDRKKVEIPVDADTSDAQSGLSDVNDTAEKLSGKQVVLDIKADIEQLKAEAKEATDRLQGVSDQGDDTNRHLDKLGGEGGLHARGQAIADLTGPLGDASGAASDFAGVFDGLSDIASDVAGKVGLSAAAMETALGGVGLVVAAIAAGWTIVSGNQQKAKQRLKDLTDQARDFNKAIQEGDVAAAAKQLADNYAAAYRAGKNIGFTVEETTSLLLDQKMSWEDIAAVVKDKFGPQLKSLDIAKLVDANNAIHDGNDALIAGTGLVTEIGSALNATGRAGEKAGTDIAGGMDKATEHANATKEAISGISDELSNKRAIEDFQSNALIMFDNVKNKGATPTRDEIRGLEDDIVHAGEVAGANPIDIQSTVDALDRGDFDTVVAQAQKWADQTPVNVSLRISDQALKAASDRLSGLAAKYGYHTDANGNLVKGASVSSTSLGVTQVFMPSGSRSNVVRDVTRHTRRAGRRYGATR